MTDRVREALFSSLGSAVSGALVVDLYAGSGSIGLEALSRGAADVVFVERDRAALSALRSNIDAVGLGGKVWSGDAARFLRSPRSGVTLAFVDPPYTLPLASVREDLERLEPMLSDEAVVVVHRRAGEDPPDRIGRLELVERRRYGDAELWRYHKGAP